MGGTIGGVSLEQGPGFLSREYIPRALVTHSAVGPCDSPGDDEATGERSSPLHRRLGFLGRWSLYEHRETTELGLWFSALLVAYLIPPIIGLSK